MSLRIFESLHDVTQTPAGGRVIAIGVFDGVHRGHQRILLEAVEKARLISGCVPAAITFRPHPETVLRPRPAPRLLTPLSRKAELMEGLGIQELLVVKFDRAFAQLSPADFCRLVLSDHLDACVVLVGENFRFGHRGAGGPDDLRTYGRRHGFEVRTVTMAHEGAETISSTRIRNLIGVGRVSEAAHLLGRPHRIEGVVVPGLRRGRTLHAPTANLAVEAETAVPHQGVYITRSFLDDSETHFSLTSIGTNPTFEVDKKLRIETFLFDYQGDAYGRRLALEFLERVRNQQAFSSAEALAHQISLDVEAAKRYLAGRPD
ncbi:MAG: bifunctional riboflavin kinase/FAD synthetase [Thermoleophilia bacterium]|jgi:riboflavin kinase/FMN adenylyltransferase